MRRIIYIGLIMLSGQLTLAVPAQSLDEIANAFKTRDAAEVKKYFDNSVEITVQNEDSTYAKNRAEAVLNNFFAVHRPKTFVVVHQGSSPHGSKFLIGNLATDLGNYRTYLYAKAVSGSLLLEEIRFEKK